MFNFDISFPAQTIWIISIVVLLYFVIVMFLGIYFSRFSASINDFFFSGQRFSWWLPTMSMVATGIGSYSYIKYSQQGFNTGISSTHIYFNDWFLFPVFIFGWLPILYFNRIKSVPDYFEKRFNSLARYISVFIILAYIFYYIGFNLFTIGIAIEGIFGIPAIISLPIVTLFIGIYTSIGGQTAVIFTDCLQGIILFVVGLMIVACGLYAVGGIYEFWAYLPETHRMPLAPFNSNPYFNTVGIFWGDSLVGSVAFLYMNQGFLMRFLTVKNIHHARIAALSNMMITLPISALVIGGTGWIAKSIMSKQKVLGGSLPGYEFLQIDDSAHTFLATAFNVIQNSAWMMGFIFAALISALMSTVDSLINASASIGIYDIYKPLIRPQASKKHYLKVARFTSILATFIGLLLVIWFYKQKGTLMSIHYKGIMLIIPSVVTTIFCGIFWKNYNSLSACASMLIGIIFTFLTMIFPEPVEYIRRLLLGAPSGDIIYFRAAFGVMVTFISGAAIQWLLSIKFIRNKIPWSRLSLVFRIFTQGMDKDASDFTIHNLYKTMFHFKGETPLVGIGKKFKHLHFSIKDHLSPKEVSLSKNVCEFLEIDEGDLVYIADQRWYLGGVRSGRFTVASIHQQKDNTVFLSQTGQKHAFLIDGRAIFVEKTM